MVLPTEEGEHEVACGGHDLGGGAGPDGGPIFVEGDIADVVQAILDAPMAADQGEQARGISALWRQAGDVVGDLDAGIAGRDATADRDAVALNTTDLVDVRPGCSVRASTPEPTEESGMHDGPERPQLPPSVANFGVCPEEAGDPPTLVTQPAWGDRDAGAVLGCGQPGGKTPPQPP